MEPLLRSYVDFVRDACARPLSDPARIRRIRQAAARLVRSGFRLSPEDREVPAGAAYGRNLLYRDPDHGFVVIAMVWPPGVRGEPHDHGTWGVVAVLEGAVRIENFSREDDGSDPRRADLLEVCSLDGAPGDTGYVLPPHEDIHAVSNALADRTSISIHTYGRDIRDCNLFDRETGEVKPVTLEYHRQPVGG